MKIRSTTSVMLPLFVLAGFMMTSCGSDTDQQAAESRVQVDVETAETRSAKSTHRFPGQVESKNRSNLSTIVMGTLTGVLVDVGDEVRKGDILARVKDDQILAQQNQLEANKVQAEANLENTRKNYERIQNLYAEESATSKELDDISTMYEIARANMEALEAGLREVDEMLGYTVIRAPFDGTISRKHLKEGDMATPGHPIVSIADPEALKITATVPEHIINRVEAGLEVAVSVASADIHHAQARLTSISQVGDPASRQYAIEAELSDDQYNRSLKSGQFAEVSVALDDQPALLIPRSALVERGQLTGIYTLSSDQRAVLRWVRTGHVYGEDVEVISGLAAGESYVARSEQPVRHGQLLSTR